MKNILLGISFVVGMSIASYYIGYGFALIGTTIESVFTTYPENKYRWK